MAERMNEFTGKEWLQHSFSIWRDITKTSEERATKHPAMFPQQLAEKLIRIYTKGSAVVLDPFMGTGSTLMAARTLGRPSIGIELNPEFCKLAKSRLDSLDSTLFETSTPYQIHNLDSRVLSKEIQPESVDLVITSPPYWDILNQRRTADQKEIRNYSGSEDDLGNIANYDAFLSELKQVFQEVFITMKKNTRCISIVMDIRKKDKFFPLHQDQSRIMQEIGFELEEYVIWDRQHEYNNMKTLGYPWVFRFNKVHEYICIYWKR